MRISSLDDNLVAADEKIGAARQSLDQARRELKRERMPADHPLILAYNQAAQEYNESLLAWSAGREAIGWQVKADHPILARPDRDFRGDDAEASARLFAKDLEGMGFDNITVTPVKA
jgi:hypothetical protein